MVKLQTETDQEWVIIDPSLVYVYQLAARKLDETTEAYKLLET